MKRKNVTIKDIAEYVGVSISTVSRALKNHENISQEVKVKVNQAAEKLGYKTIYKTVHFRPKKQKLIGMILPKVGNFFTPHLASSIEKTVKTKGYNLIIFQSHNLIETEKECVQLCKDFGLDGLLVSLTKQTKSLEHFNDFFEKNIPIVFVDRIIDDKQREISAVTIDDKQAAKKAVKYLIGKGYKNIAGAFSSKNLQNTKARKKGFQEALERAGLAFNPNLCYHANTKDESKQKFLKLIKTQGIPDAIFVMADNLLVGVMQAVYENQIAIPQQMGIISISHGNLPTYLNPNITHIRHSANDIGEKAALSLINLIEHPSRTKKERINMPVYLVEMDSCRTIFNPEIK